MTWIVNRLNYIGDFFYELYLDCYYAGWPLEVLDSWFYAICELFYNLAWDFHDFNLWLDYAAGKITEILSYSDMWSYFGYWFDRAEWAWSWVTDSFWNVWNIVDDWWSSTRYDVLAWIEDAVSGVRTLIDQANIWLASLQSAWDDFKGRIPTIDQLIYWWGNWSGNVLTTIDTWWTGTLLEVQGLIDSAFIIRSDFWSGWQDWRDKVTEFFTDPEDWLYKSLDRIIERFW